VITVAGLTPSLDLTYTVDSLALGQIHRVPDVISCAGGKALNMARAATTVGATPTVVAILGGATGRTLSSLLRAEGLAVVTVESPAETRTCVSIASRDTGLLTEVYQEAAAIPADVWAAFRSSLTAALPNTGGWLSISGRTPLGTTAVIAELVRLGQDAGAAVAVDTHSEALPEALEARPALVKINRYEAADLLGVEVDSDLRAMADAIRARCGAIVVLTDGTAGSVAVEEGAAWRAEAPARVGRYPVGSGDSFLGGLLATLDGGGVLADALRTATACGVANAQVPGQGQFTYVSFGEIAATVRISPLA
jgi:1-phosphofructokinase family hexose kinase